ncbi:universal stress protein [Mesorhizobium sp. CN2-181]|uniref:universal stress protein n=1 Tax=Mesorhizobium yinganensis TaxID=3157707 RepID=UPI0032B869F8
MQVPKDSVVYLDSVDSSTSAPRIRYAAVLAQGWGAHVVVALAPQNMTLDRHDGFARGDATTAMLEGCDQRKNESVDIIRNLLAETEAEFGITVELRVCGGEIGEALMLHARHSALAVLGASCRPEAPTTALSLSEDLTFASGTPWILVPGDWPVEWPIRRIVVGWNASREAARAIRDAMPFLAAADDVHLIVVPEPKILRLHGAAPGTDISWHLARHGVAVTLERLEGHDAGSLILSRAAALDADLIVVGAYGQARISEFVFGSATKTLLATPPLPILLSR